MSSQDNAIFYSPKESNEKQAEYLVTRVKSLLYEKAIPEAKKKLLGLYRAESENAKYGTPIPLISEDAIASMEDELLSLVYGLEQAGMDLIQQKDVIILERGKMAWYDTMSTLSDMILHEESTYPPNTLNTKWTGKQSSLQLFRTVWDEMQFESGDWRRTSLETARRTMTLPAQQTEKGIRRLSQPGGPSRVRVSLPSRSVPEKIGEAMSHSLYRRLRRS